MPGSLDRRNLLRCLASVPAGALLPGLLNAGDSAWRPRYALASCLFGMMDLDDILPHVRQTGATHIDLWPRIHGNQREQIDHLGHEKFAEKMADHQVQLGVLTRYDLGPFRLDGEIEVARKLGASVIVCGSDGPRGLKADGLKSAVKTFVMRMRPGLAKAEDAGITLAIENHGNSLIESPDSLRWLTEFSENKPLGIALAPYHLPQDPRLIAGLITDLGQKLAILYAWQHGKGASEPLPMDEQRTQLPGRGPLDFAPIVAMLADQKFAGFVEIFMHSTPRGIPIGSSAAAVTSEVNRAREHLERLLDS